MTQTLIAGALGECVHVAGVSNFLRLAESAGWHTIFLGPAAPIETFIAVARRECANEKTETLLIGVSYRLTPEMGERLQVQFAEEAAGLHERGARFAFAGTPPVAASAQALSFFEKVFG